MFRRFITYIRESKDELQKVVWPSRKETIKNTMLVIGISLFVAVFLGMIDIGLTYVLEIIL
jgi:preprotein translocase subunit SecE